MSSEEHQRYYQISWQGGTIVLVEHLPFFCDGFPRVFNTWPQVSHNVAQCGVGQIIQCSISYQRCLMGLKSAVCRNVKFAVYNFQCYFNAVAECKNLTGGHTHHLLGRWRPMHLCKIKTYRHPALSKLCPKLQLSRWASPNIFFGEIVLFLYFVHQLTFSSLCACPAFCHSSIFHTENVFVWNTQSDSENLKRGRGLSRSAATNLK